MSNSICEENNFRDSYLTHSEHLRNFLYYKSGNLKLSEDLVQDAFTKMWENCSKVALHKVKSYLFTVAHNLFINKVHHEKVVLKFQKTTVKTTNLQDPQFLLEEQEFKMRLESAISNLPEGQRIVFLMNRIDKKKYREIAEELNISVKAVEKRMHLAISTLRKIHKEV